MFNVKLYTQANDLQRQDARMLLEEFGNKMKWKSHGDRIIDIGTGDGGVLIDIIKKYIPDNYEVIVGCDINEESVRYADKRYSNERIKFITLNIEDEIPETLQSSFDHVFSLHVMHWVQNQRRAFQNVYDLLEKGGDMLIMLIGYMPAFEVFQQVSKNEKWAMYVGDVNKYISPYHESTSPEIEIKEIMEQIGFENIEIECKMKCYKFKDIEYLKKTVITINPFKVPDEMYEEFIEEMIDTYLKITNDNKSQFELGKRLQYLVNYNLITVYGTK